MYDAGNPKPVLCDNLEGWEIRREVWGGFKREGTYVYLMPTHADVQQKPSNYCNYPLIKKKNFAIYYVSNSDTLH